MVCRTKGGFPFSWGAVGCTEEDPVFVGSGGCTVRGSRDFDVIDGERRSKARCREEGARSGIGVGSRGRYGTMPGMAMQGEREEMEKRKRD